MISYLRLNATCLEAMHPVDRYSVLRNLLKAGRTVVWRTPPP